MDVATSALISYSFSTVFLYPPAAYNFPQSAGATSDQSLQEGVVRKLLCIVLLYFSGLAVAMDYHDHRAICALIDANTTHALSLDTQARQQRCICEVAELEKLLKPDKYRVVIDWRIDPKAFAKNRPNEALEVMSEAFTAGTEAALACK